MPSQRTQGEHLTGQRHFSGESSTNGHTHGERAASERGVGAHNARKHRSSDRNTREHRNDAHEHRTNEQDRSNDNDSCSTGSPPPEHVSGERRTNPERASSRDPGGRKRKISQA